LPSNAYADSDETFKGVVQLSGFVSSRDDINGAVRVASAVSNVKSVANEMQASYSSINAP
jgi:osmotically-inducible protein OsmY